MRLFWQSMCECCLLRLQMARCSRRLHKRRVVVCRGQLRCCCFPDIAQKIWVGDMKREVEARSSVTVVQAIPGNVVLRPYHVRIIVCDRFELLVWFGAASLMSDAV